MSSELGSSTWSFDRSPNFGVQFNGGGINQGNIDIHAVMGPGEPEQPIESRRSRKLPVPLSCVSTLSAAVSLVTFFTGWKAATDAWQWASSLDAPDALPHLPSLRWLVAFVVSGLLAAVGWSSVGFLRKHVLKFSRIHWLPAIVGAKCRDGRTRLMLVRFSAACVKCGSRMRFLDRESDGRDIFDLQSGRTVKHVTTQRRPAVVCTRNSDHWGKIDVAVNDYDKPFH